MDFVQNCGGYWKSLLLWAILLRLLRLDSLKYVVELGHVLDKGVCVRLEDLIESNPR